jgi:murein DD-endopeptidase MepM/ murein hydrolase activator NlpD
VRRILVTTAAVVAAVSPAAAHARQPATLAPGDRGSAVRLVQRALTRVGVRTSADGVFGRLTARSVRRYERRVRIRVDGRVSRGQARGLLRRAGMDPRLAVRRWPVARTRLRAASAGPAGAFPVQGAWGRGDGFGTRGGRHQGIDLAAACGTPLVAPADGRVVFTGRHDAAGHYVVVRAAATGEDHVFMHLQAPSAVERGAAVRAGRRVGAVGATGNATGCHLHFEIWTRPGWYEGGRPRDPAPDLGRWSGAW